jgi:two-component system chemotaxis response regulator CheY
MVREAIGSASAPTAIRIGDGWKAGRTRGGDDLYSGIKRYYFRALKPRRRFVDQILTEQVNMNILIVDDSMALRKILQRVIRQAGIVVGQVQEAADGLAALLCLEQFKPDVILSDINMPNMDGIEFLRKLKSCDTLKSFPVIMVSTEASRERVMEAIELGACNFIRKPFSEDDIREKFSLLAK